jgi:hypothetical protein
MQAAMIAYAIFAAIVILIVVIVLVASGISAIVNLVRRRKLAASEDAESPNNP